ncbi:MAG TPA: geranylgeranyl reductase family protein, partial [Acidimicrobiales bacterium]|nr:geranylgeranyl reductase family protein [Acidimicrobiales bacterium]
QSVLRLCKHGGVPSRYDAVVVGAGPAGSVAALVLARGGLRVALVDKASFPRDKACGDLVGPRGVQLLDELGIDVTGPRVGDMQVVGPTGRQVLLRAFPGVTYPGFGFVLPRLYFDAQLRKAALDAGAEGLTGRADEPRFDESGELIGFRLASGLEVCADVVIGADGALTRVGQAAGLVDERRVLWGFAIRGYVDAMPDLPQIMFWEPSTWAGYPGYGWLFPGLDGIANIGLGVGVRGDRREGARAARDLDAFVKTVVGDSAVRARLGGWLKMGMVGTIPARGRTLLVGDAAGLVNSLQGEGIAQAIGSGRAAADAVLTAGPSGAADQYRAALRSLYAPYAARTAPLTAAMLGRPRVVAGVGRLLTAPGLGRLLSGGWAVYWNDLLEGASSGWPRRTAAVAHAVAGLSTTGTRDRRDVMASLEASTS